jgi:hypothetical protein
MAAANGDGNVGFPDLRTSFESRSGSGVFAVRSSQQIRLIWFTGQPPLDDSREPTATHTLQESRRVCESIAWLVGRSDFARGRVMKHRDDSIVAIANTPEPSVE